MCQVRPKGFWILFYSTYTPLTVGILYRRKTSDLFQKLWTMSSLGFFPVWIQKVTQELKITPWCCESTWKNDSHVSVCHLSKWMRALPAATIVSCNKASSCSPSKWDESSHRLAACGTRGTKVSDIKTALDNITGLSACMGCCFQSFGIDCDTSYTHYFHPPNHAKRTLWRDIKSTASWAAPTQPIGLTASLPSLCSHTAMSLSGQYHA